MGWRTERDQSITGNKISEQVSSCLLKLNWNTQCFNIDPPGDYAWLLEEVMSKHHKDAETAEDAADLAVSPALSRSANNNLMRSFWERWELIAVCWCCGNAERHAEFICAKQEDAWIGSWLHTNSPRRRLLNTKHKSLTAVSYTVCLFFSDCVCMCASLINVILYSTRLLNIC